MASPQPYAYGTLTPQSSGHKPLGGVAKMALSPRPLTLTPPASTGASARSTATRAYPLPASKVLEGEFDSVADEEHDAEAVEASMRIQQILDEQLLVDDDLLDDGDDASLVASPCHSHADDAPQTPVAAPASHQTPSLSQLLFDSQTNNNANSDATAIFDNNNDNNNTMAVTDDYALRLSQSQMRREVHTLRLKCDEHETTASAALRDLVAERARLMEVSARAERADHDLELMRSAHDHLRLETVRGECLQTACQRIDQQRDQLLRRDAEVAELKCQLARVQRPSDVEFREVNHLLEENSRLNAICDAYRRDAQRTESLQGHLSELTALKAHHVHRLELLQAQLGEARQTEARLSETIEARDAQVATLETDLRGARVTNKSLSEQLAHLQRNSSVQTATDKLDASLEALRTRYERDLARVNAQRDDALRRVDQLERQIAGVVDDLDMVHEEEEEEELSREVETREESVQTSAIVTYEVELRAAQEHVEALERQIAVLEASVESLQANAHSAVAGARAEWARLHDDSMDRLRNEHSRELADCQVRHKSALEAVQAQVSARLDANSTLAETVMQLEQRLEEAHATHQRRVEELQCRLDEAQATHQTRVEELQCRLDEAQATHQTRVEELQCRLDEAQATHQTRVEELQCRLDEAQATHQTRVGEMEAHLASQTEQSAAAIAHVSRELEEERSRVSHLDGQLEHAQRAEAEMQVLLGEQENGMRKAEGAVERFERELDALVAERDVLVDERDAQRREIDELRAQADAAHVALTDLIRSGMEQSVAESDAESNASSEFDETHLVGDERVDMAVALQALASQYNTALCDREAEFAREKTDIETSLRNAMSDAMSAQQTRMIAEHEQRLANVVGSRSDEERALRSMVSELQTQLAEVQATLERVRKVHAAELKEAERDAEGRIEALSKEAAQQCDVRVHAAHDYFVAMTKRIGDDAVACHRATLQRLEERFARPRTNKQK